MSEAKIANLEDFFREVPIQEEVTVELPSKGLLYKFTDGSNKLRIRPLSLGDEKAIATNKTLSVAETMTELLGRVMLNLIPQDLLLMDKLAVILKVREISVSPKYVTVGICTHCTSENTLNFPLDQLPLNQVPDDFSLPVRVELPICGTKGMDAHIILPRLSDEQYVSDAETAFDNIYRFVENIGEVDSKPLIREILDSDKFPYADAIAITKAMYGVEYGVQTDVKYECAACKGVNTAVLQINDDFFTGN